MWSPKVSWLSNTAQVCTMPLATCAESMLLSSRMHQEGRRWICLMPALPPGAVVHSVVVFLVDLSALWADTFCALPRQYMVGGFTTCGATSLGLS